MVRAITYAVHPSAAARLRRHGEREGWVTDEGIIDSRADRPGLSRLVEKLPAFDAIVIDAGDPRVDEVMDRLLGAGARIVVMG